MQKKRLHINIAAFIGILCCFGQSGMAQNVTLSVPISNIIGKSPFQQAAVVGKYNGVLGLAQTINFKSLTPFTNGPNSIPLSAATLQITKVGTTLTLISNAPKLSLTSNDQAYFSAVITLNLVAGDVLVNFEVNTANRTFLPGTFSTQLDMYAPGLLGLGNIMAPTSTPINLIIPAFTTPQIIGNSSILVNDLNYFRSTGVNIDKITSLSTTVPYQAKLKTASPNFSFSTTATYKNLPNTAVSAVTAKLKTSTTTYAATPLSNTVQSLSGAVNIPVPTNNTESQTYTFGISASDLKSNFLQAGTYTTDLNYTWDKAATAPTYTSGGAPTPETSKLEVIVSDMSELVVNQTAVSIDFNSANDYKNGVSKDMLNHITLSKTTPYNLYIRASLPTFNNGPNSIPLNIIRIGPATGQTGMNTVTLSNTAQLLIDNADPVIDRNLSVRYSIPATETSKLLNKPTGSYSTDIIYSFVAP